MLLLILCPTKCQRAIIYIKKDAIYNLGQRLRMCHVKLLVRCLYTTNLFTSTDMVYNISNRCPFGHLQLGYLGTSFDAFLFILLFLALTIFLTLM